MRWPFVSKRYAEYLEATIHRLQTERDEQQSRADRAIDQLSMQAGGQPISTLVRRDVQKEIEAEKEKNEAIAALYRSVDADAQLDVEIDAGAVPETAVQ